MYILFTIDLKANDNNAGAGVRRICENLRIVSINLRGVEVVWLRAIDEGIVCISNAGRSGVGRVEG